MNRQDFTHSNLEALRHISNIPTQAPGYLSDSENRAPKHITGNRTARQPLRELQLNRQAAPSSMSYQDRKPASFYQIDGEFDRKKGWIRDGQRPSRTLGSRRHVFKVYSATAPKTGSLLQKAIRKSQKEDIFSHLTGIRDWREQVTPERSEDDENSPRSILQGIITNRFDPEKAQGTHISLQPEYQSFWSDDAPPPVPPMEYELGALKIPGFPPPPYFRDLTNSQPDEPVCPNLDKYILDSRSTILTGHIPALLIFPKDIWTSHDNHSSKTFYREQPENGRRRKDSGHFERLEQFIFVKAGDIVGIWTKEEEKSPWQSPWQDPMANILTISKHSKDSYGEYRQLWRLYPTGVIKYEVEQFRPTSAKLGFEGELVDRGEELGNRCD
ncbi:hypothetical protein BJ508DRAFT_359813 [Ascobolus immersus RN42]|uniref:Uncharacterized protein n=1 Tax=Ascobolus immersus RN42 TaxID=1160509 RepID=A0A3N4IK18_ASCIM|nr:hypothetical protein BJ508DRAFT_359813 [Ascobolus immersus RN42]